MRSKILVMLTLATLAGCCVDECSAQLFRRRRAQVPSQACPGGVCPRPGYGGGGQLQVNANGGFTGQLPNSFYQQYTGQTAVQRSTPVTAVLPQVVSPTAVKVAVAGSPSKTITVEQAQALLEAAQAKVYAAEVEVKKASSNARRLAAIAAAEAEAERQLTEIEAMKASAVKAAEVDAEIRDLEIANSAKTRELAALKQYHKALSIKAGNHGD